MGGALALRPGQRVAEDEPSLGVGVGDLDRLAVQGADDVAGPRRVRAGHVLDRRGDGQHGDTRRKLGRRGDGVDDGRRARLVGLHLAHVGRRLEADATAVEGHALADHGQEAPAGVALLVGARAQRDEARLVGGTAAHGHEEAHAHLGRLLRAEDAQLHAELAGDLAGLVGEDLGADVVGGTLGQPAGPVAAVADDLAALGAQVQGIGIARFDGEGALVERRRQAVVRVPVDRGRLGGAFDEAAGELLDDGTLEGPSRAHELVGDMDGEPPHVAAREAADDDGPQATRAHPVDALSVRDAHGQDEADAHLRGRDEPCLPERALDGAEGAHGLDGAAEPAVDLDEELGQLDPGRHGDGQDVGLHVPWAAFFHVQAHTDPVSREDPRGGRSDGGLGGATESIDWLASP